MKNYTYGEFETLSKPYWGKNSINYVFNIKISENYIYGDFDFDNFIFQNPTDEKIKLIIVLIKKY